MKLVYYSLSMSGDEYDNNRVFQLINSIKSLRKFNSSIRVQLHLFGELPPSIVEKLVRLNVHIVPFESYTTLIEQSFAGVGKWLSRYPVMHKFLTMQTFIREKLDQVLYLDSDTYINADINILFNKYNEADLYAREEPGCRLSKIGYHPDYLNEEKLFELATQQGCNYVAPFNSGVVLMNQDVWKRMLDHSNKYIGYVAGCSLWIEQKINKSDVTYMGYQFRTNFPDLNYLHDHKSELSKYLESIDPMPFPSVNYWIKEQVALWLTLGRIEDVAIDYFHMNDVLQGGEELNAPGQLKMPVVSHYFSHNTRAFLDAVNANSSLYRKPG